MHKSENITKHNSVINNSDRYTAGTLPHVIWMTGLSGSGKSTIGADLEAKLISMGYHAFMLDGDNLRYGLNSNLGFSEEDRTENIRRIAETARIMAMSGCITIVSAISPMTAMRYNARRIIESDAVFTEVYIDTSIEECARRDPKGLYKKAFAGEISNFTGVSAPYQKPVYPEITVKTENKSVSQCSDIILNAAVDIQMPLEKIVSVSIGAAIQAGSKIMEIYQRDFDIKIKDDQSPVTEADIAADKIISDILKRSFPFYSILCEETADECDKNGVPKRLLSRCCFIVDPLDGTKEFIKRNGEFTVNIAFAENHKSVAGVIYIPVKDTLYYSAKNRGAYKIENASAYFSDNNPRLFCPADRIHASSRSENLIVMASRSHFDSQTAEMLELNKDRFSELISAGSSLKGCYIAEGKADVHYRFGNFTKEWDTAAMQSICEEAGAVFTRGDGKPMLYNRIDVKNQLGFIILNKSENKFRLE